MAQSVIGALRVNLGLDSAQFLKGAKQAQGSAQQLAARMAKVGAAVAAVGTGIALAVRGQLATATEISRQAQVANTSVEQFQRFASAARHYGIEQDKLSDILKDMSDRVGDFLTTGGGPMADFFEKIAPKVGVTAEQFRDLSGADALQLYVSSLEKANLSQSEMTFFMEAIAGDATLLLPLLRDNGAELNRLADAAQRAGLHMSKDAVESARKFSENLQRLRDLLGGLVVQITAELAPVLERMSSVLVNLGERFGAMSPTARRFAAIAAGLTVVLGPLILGLAAVVASLGVILSPIGAVVFGIAALAGAAALAAANWDQLVERLPILKDFADYGRRVASAWRNLPAIKWALLIPVVRWASFIPGLRWLSFVRPIQWATVLPTIRWAALAGTLRWGSLITPLVWGARFIPVIGWAVTAGMLAWSLLIKPLGWDKFIPRINWRDWVPEINWSNLFGGATAGSAARRVGADAAQGLADGIAAGQVAVEQAAEAAAGAAETSSRARLQTRSPSRVFMQIGLDLMNGLGLGIQQGAQGPVERMHDVAGSISEAMQSANDGVSRFASGFASFVGPIVRVSQSISQAVVSMAQRVADNLFTSGLTTLGGALGSALGLGSGKGFGGFLGSLFSFDGGGYTGNGPRSGGLDGKGGFLSIMHPDETVIDHTKGQPMAGAGGELIQVVIHVLPSGEFDARVENTARAVVRVETPGMIRDGFAQAREARIME